MNHLLFCYTFVEIEKSGNSQIRNLKSIIFCKKNETFPIIFLNCASLKRVHYTLCVFNGNGWWVYTLWIPIALKPSSVFSLNSACLTRWLTVTVNNKYHLVDILIGFSASCVCVFVWKFKATRKQFFSVCISRWGKRVKQLVTRSPHFTDTLWSSGIIRVFVWSLYILLNFCLVLYSNFSFARLPYMPTTTNERKKLRYYKNEQEKKNYRAHWASSVQISASTIRLLFSRIHINSHVYINEQAWYSLKKYRRDLAKFTVIIFARWFLFASLTRSLCLYSQNKNSVVLFIYIIPYCSFERNVCYL